MRSGGTHQLKRGLNIAYQEWGKGNSKRILALHGWLDNSNTFVNIAPKLADNDYHVVAVDFVGHGRSDYLKEGAYMGFNYIPSIREFTDELNWNRYIMLGHSLGGVISSLYTAVYTEKVEKLIMIDSLGPWSQPPEKAVSILRKALEHDMQLATKPPRDRKPYAALNDAVEARIKNVSTYPGNQSLSKEAAIALVSRGVVNADDSLVDESNIDLNQGPVYFRHDPRLMKLSYYYMTNEQAVAFMNAISCKTLLVTGTTGWPLGTAGDVNARKKPLEDKGLLTHIELSGSHHLHLDPETAPEVANTILKFLASEYEFGNLNLENASDA